MALIRWEPAAELNTIQNEMNRLFNTFFDQPTPTGRGGTTSRRWMPAMDLIETADHYVLRADLPGLSDDDDVNLQLEDNVLTISGERNTQHEQDEEGYYRIERAFGSFARSLTLPDGVNPDRCRPTSTAACSRSGSPSRSRRSPDRSRSPSVPAQPTTPRRSRAPTPATRRPTATNQSPHPPSPQTAIGSSRETVADRGRHRRGPRLPTTSDHAQTRRVVHISQHAELRDARAQRRARQLSGCHFPVSLTSRSPTACGAACSSSHGPTRRSSSTSPTCNSSTAPACTYSSPTSTKPPATVGSCGSTPTSPARCDASSKSSASRTSSGP